MIVGVGEARRSFDGVTFATRQGLQQVEKRRRSARRELGASEDMET